MNRWKVRNANRLLTEVKNQLSEGHSTKDVRWAIEHNRCFVNNRVECFGSKKVSKGDEISFFFKQRPQFKIENERILYEDSHLLVYNKPIYLTSEVLARLADCELVHRLDRDTTGAIVLAKNIETKSSLEELFKKRKVQKEYLAIVEGRPEESGVISGNMKVISRREGAVMWGMAEKGVWSKTVFKRVSQEKNQSLLLCQPITGRTHQIRVHLKKMGHPISGDFVYGSRIRKGKVFRPLLHAYQLQFLHPITKEALTLAAPIPKDFENISPHAMFSQLTRSQTC